MNSIVEKVRIPIQKIVEENGLILYDLEYLKEEGTFFLRVSIERPDKTMDFDTCSVISEKISDLLDEIDPISHEYILEVCSPGAERPPLYVQRHEILLRGFLSYSLSAPLCRFGPLSLSLPLRLFFGGQRDQTSASSLCSTKAVHR